ncbi:SMI1/KNR4 family protein [Hymenobacter crusticola]|uniref:Knr4/Smi1-like domain-containing protein n=1 Tax=Hymenobacter crusticola TaxID=1770526 RepID=A0A243W4Q9_9BACT|nr:SMI1/KNR4 family protein [Hymenobacter crusticola]OUJ65685.1 hypothetical protein BXP70_29135 [Hymenobacter crusticola]
MTLDALLHTWRQQAIKLNAGATPALLAAAEAELHFHFPDDFKRLYAVANGFRDADCTEGLMSLWPLEMICVEYQRSTTPEFISFCDYSIHCHYIGFLRHSAGVYKQYQTPVFLCHSFWQAIDWITRAHPAIY